ncbi:hypothetical protein AYI69_g1450 [Smittium culicis]|uniref:Uncharacterized protein n=1 Tax=Smittium culicis TaxID=133412 RepID=A0A1R1YQ86_9FUNG|nr:hypothetical protein AYI69_g1450 [Smittium culicis]
MESPNNKEKICVKHKNQETITQSSPNSSGASSSLENKNNLVHKSQSTQANSSTPNDHSKTNLIPQPQLTASDSATNLDIKSVPKELNPAPKEPEPIKSQAVSSKSVATSSKDSALENIKTKRPSSQSELAGEKIGSYLLNGWTLLDRICSNESCIGVPLVRNSEMIEKCALCETSYITEKNLLKKLKTQPKSMSAQAQQAPSNSPYAQLNATSNISKISGASLNFTPQVTNNPALSNLLRKHESLFDTSGAQAAAINASIIDKHSHNIVPNPNLAAAVASATNNNSALNNSQILQNIIGVSDSRPEQLLRNEKNTYNRNQIDAFNKISGKSRPRDSLSIVANDILTQKMHELLSALKSTSNISLVIEILSAIEKCADAMNACSKI